jgi:hypothetical protein
MSTLSIHTRTRWPRPGSSPAAARGRVVVFGSVDLGLWLAGRFPAARVDMFVRSWAEVDRGRQRVTDGEVDGRVSVHHLAAAGLVLSRGVEGGATAN